jgi:ATP-binding cassette subfamily B protein
MKNFPIYLQHDAMDCGPTCLRMVSQFLGKKYSIQQLRILTEIGKDGVNLLGIAQAAEKIGFKTMGTKVSLKKLQESAQLPCLVHWAQNHFIVVYKISAPLEKRFLKNKVDCGKVYVADPARGLLSYTFKEFEKQWSNSQISGEKMGIALLLETTPAFYKNNTFDGNLNDKIGFDSVFTYLKNYKKLIIQLILGLVAGSILQLILPFLTQSVVDTGIINFIYLVLAAQVMLFIGRPSVDFIRSWILIHISTRVNLSILSDFLIKLLKLPVAYFERRV